MMRRIFFAALLFWAGATFAHAQALSTGLNPNAVVCPMGVFVDDGCQSAPAPTTAFFREPDAFQPGGHFNRASATFSNYMSSICGPAGTDPCRPQWNVAGVDYAIGPYTPVASLLDPAVSANWPAGCTYTAATATTAGLLACTGATPTLTIQHFNFGPVGGHGCTAVTMRQGSSSAVLIDDDYWMNDGKCNYVTGGFPSNAFAFMLATPSGTSMSIPVTLSNVYMDGKGSVFRDPQGSCATQIGCNPFSAFNIQISGLLTVKYSVINHFAGRTISMPIFGSFKVQDSYLEGSTYSVNNGHGEFFVPGGSFNVVGDYTFDHTVILQRWDTAQIGETPVFLATNWPISYNSLTFTDNVVINSFIGRTSATFSLGGCVGLDADCTAPGQTFWMKSVSAGANVGPGLFLTCGGVVVATVHQLSGAGVSPLGASYIASFDFDTTGQWAPSTIPAVSCPTATDGVGAASYNIGVLNIGSGDPIGASTITGNYIDVTPLKSTANNGTIFVIGGRTANVTGAVAGTNLVASGSATLSTGEFMYAADIPGCSTGLLNCPTVSTGGTSQPSFSLSGSANVGPETIEGFINEASFNATIAGTSMTTTTSKTLTGGDFVLGAASCGADPSTCPKIATTATGTAFTLTTSGGTVASPTAMNTLRNTANFSGTINNADPAGIASGNKLLPAVTITKGSSINGAGVTGCAGGPTGFSTCPQTTGANFVTGTLFSLSFSTSPVGPETMAVIQPTVCNTPTVFGGNVDMAAFNSSANVNAWSGVTPALTVGCF